MLAGQGVNAPETDPTPARCTYYANFRRIFALNTTDGRVLTVERVRRVDREAVDVDADVEAQLFRPLFRAVVASLAKRLDGTVQEPVEVAFVSLDMVDDRRRCDEALLIAEPTAWFRRQLSGAASLPSGEGV